MKTVGKLVGIRYPNIIGRVILKSIEEILGEENANKVFKNTQINSSNRRHQGKNLERQFTALQFSTLLIEIEHQYGELAGRGLALRAGRVCFKLMLREFGFDLGLADPEFLLLPLRKKLLAGAYIFAHAINQTDRSHVEIEEDEYSLLWQIGKCPICWQRKANTHACHFGVGLLQEGLYWLGGGKEYFVEEINCIATGADLCTFKVTTQA